MKRTLKKPLGYETFAQKKKMFVYRKQFLKLTSVIEDNFNIKLLLYKKYNRLYKRYFTSHLQEKNFIKVFFSGRTLENCLHRKTLERYSSVKDFAIYLLHIKKVVICFFLKKTCYKMPVEVIYKSLRSIEDIYKNLSEKYF